MTDVTFFDSPSLFSIPVAAMGSVGDTIQPSNMHTQMSILIPASLAAR